MICILNKESINVGDINPCLDNGRCYQNIVITIQEIQEGILQHNLTHLTMNKSDTCFRD